MPESRANPHPSCSEFLRHLAEGSPPYNLSKLVPRRPISLNQPKVYLLPLPPDPQTPVIVIARLQMPAVEMESTSVLPDRDMSVGDAAAIEDFFYSADAETEGEDEAQICDGVDDEIGEFDDAEDDGEDESGGEEAQQIHLRKAILAIQTDTQLSPVEKSKRIQALMTARWQASQNSSLKQSAEKRGGLPEDNKKPTYHKLQVLGCDHYQRGAKLKAHCCGEWHTCRFCHDELNDHPINRHDTEEMMCMHCSTVQPIAQDCSNCKKRLARYYCNVCKFWDDDPRKSIYHCHDCGVCRIGKGLGEDFFHCKACNACMTIDRMNNHKCIERNLESDCPICGDFMFTSTATVIFMPCGHCIHYYCHSEYVQTSSTCPTCSKSLGNMSSFNQRIDAMLSQQVMPPEYDNFVSHILCNDCEKRSYVKYHFVYHKCADCGSYNTKLLQTLQVDRDGHASSIPTSVGVAADMTRELEQASNLMPESPFLFNRRSALDRGAEGTEQLAGAGDGGSMISNSRLRSGSVLSMSNRPSFSSIDSSRITTVISDEGSDIERE